MKKCEVYTCYFRVYPEFKRLYQEIVKRGVITGVNTNGTLIDEEWADFFCENGVNMINITLYGKDDATYRAVCNNPNGFTQVMRAARLLKDRDIPFLFNCSLVPENINQISELYAIAESFDVQFSPSVYMFPGIRRKGMKAEQYRLTAKQAAIAEVYEIQSANLEIARETLAKVEQPSYLKETEGFSCHAGHSDFSINWKGELLPCLSFLEPKISVMENSFEKCWDYIIEGCKKMPKCQKCIGCDKQNVCFVCPAYCYAETGKADGCPDYICQLVEYKLTEMRKIVGNSV